MKITRRKFLVSAVAMTGTSLVAGKVWSTTELDDQAWKDIREFLFADRPIHNSNGIITLEAPIRPPNGGDVTVKILSAYPQNDKDFITKYYLVVDMNPSPVAAEFTLSPQTTANIATRIRINEYSNVRTIAETSQGKLYMDTKLVKASGGCSAPPMSDDSMAKLMMGKTKLLQGKSVKAVAAHEFQLSIIHPNNSGLQTNQITTHLIPAHYIETVEVKNKAGNTIFMVKGDISFSENPSFDFAYTPTEKDDVLSVKVVDSRKNIYESQWPLTLA